jgi:hypothetical protein
MKRTNNKSKVLLITLLTFIVAITAIKALGYIFGPVTAFAAAMCMLPLLAIYISVIKTN